MEEGWVLLCGAVIKQAITDMTCKPDRYKLIDPGASRRWLLDTGPWLLAVMDVPEYVDRLLALVDSVPEPSVYQLPLEMIT